MGRFILRFRGGPEAPAEDLHRLRALPNVKMIDNSSAKMLLVEGIEKDLRAAVSAMPGWVLLPEQMIKMPDPRVKVKNG